jgi:hypothetical protein
MVLAVDQNMISGFLFALSPKTAQGLPARSRATSPNLSYALSAAAEPAATVAIAHLHEEVRMAQLPAAQKLSHWISTHLLQSR